jgi:hypothetical protein
MNPAKRSSVVNYETLLADVVDVIVDARRAAARTVNAAMTTTYWFIGRRIIEEEQRGSARADYGVQLVKCLALDLSKRFGRGFSKRNLWQMRAFYLAWPLPGTMSANSPSSVTTARTGRIVQTLSAQLTIALAKEGAARFPLPWSIKEPYVLEFLGLRDEYSENDLEEALLGKLQAFLLELGGDFAFVGRQHRLRIGNEWYKVDLLFFHRRLRCLVIIDLKLGKLTHADAGQMHLYLNYARDHWALPGENPPVGLILCAEKDHAMAKYALEGLSNTVLAAEYRTTLPQERLLAEEIARTRRRLDVQRQDTLRQFSRARRARPSRSKRASGRAAA